MRFAVGIILSDETCFALTNKASFAELHFIHILVNTFSFDVCLVASERLTRITCRGKRRFPRSTLKNDVFFPGTVKVTITRHRNQLVQF